MAVKKYTDMRSVSFTVQQGAAIDSQAEKEGRKAGNLIRLATCKYLESVGALPTQIAVGVEDDEESEESEETSETEE